MISTTCLIAMNLIANHEGFRSRPFVDSDSHLRIGYGRLADHPKEVTTEAKEKEWLAKRCRNLRKFIEFHTVDVDLTPGQKGALISLVFHIGRTAFVNSRLLFFIKEGLIEEAANEFSQWIYDDGRVVKGFITRREREAAIFRAPSQIERRCTRDSHRCANNS